MGLGGAERDAHMRLRYAAYLALITNLTHSSVQRTTLTRLNALILLWMCVCAKVYVARASGQLVTSVTTSAQ